MFTVRIFGLFLRVSSGRALLVTSGHRNSVSIRRHCFRVRPILQQLMSSAASVTSRPVEARSGYCASDMTRQEQAGAGTTRQEEAGGGTTSQEEPGGGTLRQDEAGGGRTRQEEAGRNNRSHDDEAPTRQEERGGGTTRQEE
jgi:hypothetical protein